MAKNRAPYLTLDHLLRDGVEDAFLWKSTHRACLPKSFETSLYTLVAQAMNIQQEVLLFTTVIVTHPATIEKSFRLDAPLL